MTQESEQNEQVVARKFGNIGPATEEAHTPASSVCCNQRKTIG